jgi:hypothetical protein
VDGFGVPDVIDDFMDEASWPLDSLPLAELGFHQHRVEERPSVRKDCPSYAPAYIRGKGFLDDVDLLEVQRVCNL